MIVAIFNALERPKRVEAIDELMGVLLEYLEFLQVVAA